MTITELVNAAHANAVEKGWWETERPIPECLALIHSEVSEALEALRENEDPSFKWVNIRKAGKPEGFVVELADAVIRVADLCGRHGLDLEGAIKSKMEFNASRPQRHGKLF